MGSHSYASSEIFATLIFIRNIHPIVLFVYIIAISLKRQWCWPVIYIVNGVQIQKFWLGTEVIVSWIFGQTRHVHSEPRFERGLLFCCTFAAWNLNLFFVTFSWWELHSHVFWFWEIRPLLLRRQRQLQLPGWLGRGLTTPFNVVVTELFLIFGINLNFWGLYSIETA